MDALEVEGKGSSDWLVTNLGGCSGRASFGGPQVLTTVSRGVRELDAHHFVHA